MKLIAILAALFISFTSIAKAECSQHAIAGWNPSFNRDNCLESVVTVPAVPLGSVNSYWPPCSGSELQADQVADSLEKAIKKVPQLTAAGGSYYGPVGTAVGGAIGEVAEAVLLKWNNDHRQGPSACAVACIYGPAFAEVSVVNWVFSPNTGYTMCGDGAYCGGADWAGAHPHTSSSMVNKKRLYCTTFFNWSDAWDRVFGMRVLYND